MDGGSARSAEMMRAIGRPANNGPINKFNTHGIQAGRSQRAGRKAGKKIIAHVEHAYLVATDVRLDLERQQLSAPEDSRSRPNVLHERKLEYSRNAVKAFGDGGIRYISDAAHTDGDLYVYFQQNVLAVVMRCPAPVAVATGDGGWDRWDGGGLQRITRWQMTRRLVLPRPVQTWRI